MDPSSTGRQSIRHSNQYQDGSVHSDFSIAICVSVAENRRRKDVAKGQGSIQFQLDRRSHGNEVVGILHRKLSHFALALFRLKFDWSLQALRFSGGTSCHW